jgi:hypothetical protein
MVRACFHPSSIWNFEADEKGGGGLRQTAKNVRIARVTAELGTSTSKIHIR